MVKNFALAFIKLIESDYTPKYKVQSAQPAPRINLKQAADPVVLSLEELERGKKKKVKNNFSNRNLKFLQNKNRNKNKLPKPKVSFHFPR